MITHLLVPLDGSALAESTLPVAAALARRLPARISLLHVVEPDAPETVHGERHLTRPQDAQAYLDHVVEGLTAQGIHARSIVRYGSADVAKEIASMASAVSAELTVLCTHGRGGVRNAIYGSVAQQVLQQGTIPVLLIRPSEQEVFTCRLVLVPLDGSKISESALPLAEAVALAFSAQVLALSVVPTQETVLADRPATRLMPTAAAAVLDLEAVRTQEYLQDIAARLVSAGIAAHGAVERGDAVRMLVQAAQASRADLIVMATHARSGLAGAWAGSVASRVTAQTTIPILLVPIPR